MRSYSYLIPLLLLAILWSSCRKDFEFSPSSGNLEFSKDTVFLDTVFTNIGSSTYTLKVYNRSNDDIEIPTVGLVQGENSSYRLNVDGVAGKTFTNVPVLAKDSIFVFIETTFDIAPENQNDFLYTDAIHFDSGSNEQLVPLVTLVKDAIFLYPRTFADGSTESLLLGLDNEGNEIRIEGFVLEDDELQFTNEKPYVIYGYAAVADTKTLRIEAGARLHFHENSGLLIGSGGTLEVNGTLSADQELLENEVIFEGDRLEPLFDEIPGQWGTIWLAPGSIDSRVDYLTIKNATVGMLVEGMPDGGIPTLSIRNSQIFNSATVNLWARTTNVEGENLVLGGAGDSSLFCSLGGSYSFLHSTIANFWSNGFRTGAAVQLSNNETPLGGQTISADLTQASFTNCIIDGNTSIELSLRSNGSNAFNFSLVNCMLKFRDTNNQFENNPLYDFENSPSYTNLFLNGETDFLNTANNDFRIGEMSDAIDNAGSAGALMVPLDLLGRDRTNAPAIGAFQFIPEN